MPELVLEQCGLEETRQPQLSRAELLVGTKVSVRLIIWPVLSILLPCGSRSKMKRSFQTNKPCGNEQYPGASEWFCDFYGESNEDMSELEDLLVDALRKAWILHIHPKHVSCWWCPFNLYSFDMAFPVHLVINTKTNPQEIWIIKKRIYLFIFIAFSCY